MNLNTLPIACAALFALTFADAALAADFITVKLQTPVAARTKVIAGGVMFVCEADACSTQTEASQVFAASTCKVIAKTAGPVVSFGGPRRSLDTDKLAACNDGVLGSTQVAKR